MTDQECLACGVNDLESGVAQCDDSFNLGEKSVDEHGCPVGADQICRCGLDRNSLPFAISNQAANGVLKIDGESNVQPGINEVSKNPFRRSTIPYDSGSHGLD